MTLLDDEAVDWHKVKKWFDIPVDDVYENEETLETIVTFMMKYTLHAAPKDWTHKQMRMNQLEAYEADPQEEIDNLFPSFIEYLTKSDMAWCPWQYINSFDYWQMKKVNKKGKFWSKYTGDKHHRYQPTAESEGMQLYNKLLEWHTGFKSHPEFKKKARVLSNRIAKEMKILPTWTLGSGPKRKFSRTEEDDADVEAPVLTDYASDDELDGHCFGDVLCNTTSRTGRGNGNNEGSSDESSVARSVVS